MVQIRPIAQTTQVALTARELEEDRENKRAATGVSVREGGGNFLTRGPAAQTPWNSQGESEAVQVAAHPDPQKPSLRGRPLLDAAALCKYLCSARQPCPLWKVTSAKACASWSGSDKITKAMDLERLQHEKRRSKERSLHGKTRAGTLIAPVGKSKVRAETSRPHCLGSCDLVYSGFCMIYSNIRKESNT